MTDAHARLPYAEPDSPGVLYPDCQAAGSNLHVHVSPVTRVVTPPGPRGPLQTSYAVPAAAARLAGSLHLHLN